MPRLPARLSLAALALAGALFHPNSAPACAILPIDVPDGPRLSVERVALLYDEGQKMEHFIREVQFDQASGAFAFVVPTPTRPELAAVTSPPFDALQSAFPLEPPPQEPSRSFFGGEAKSAVPPSQGVTILSTERIGKFTAFTLAASDPAALARWLHENRITVPPGGREWLDHYVGLKFYFAAFRYEAPARGPVANTPPPPQSPPSSGYATPPGVDSPPPAPPPPVPPYSGPPSMSPGTAMTSETVRLSFSTPVPFFPYLEPAHGSRQDSSHTMEVWLVSHHPREPRLRRMAQGQPARWAWPWAARMAYETGAEDVARPLGELGTLLPRDGSYHVQTFRDERVNRDGWGDILFPVAESPPEEPSWLATATSFLGDLEHGIHTGVADPSEAESESAFRVSPSARGCACHLAPLHDDTAAWLSLAALGLTLTLRRARRRPGSV